MNLFIEYKNLIISIFDNKKTPINRGLSKYVLYFYVLEKSGNDLLSQILRPSTIGAKGFLCLVRNGIESATSAIITRLFKDIVKIYSFFIIYYYIKSNSIWKMCV